MRFAVLGCGHIGKRHAEMIRANGEAELVALVDIKEKSTLGIDHFGVPFYPSLEAYLKDGPEADVINIATPNGLHGRQALQALEAKKHVLIEKPMALHKSEAEAIIEKGAAVRRQVFTVTQNRYSPPSEWMKAMVDSGRLGKVYMVQLNCFWNRDGRYYTPGSWHGTKDLDGGTLFTQFSHFIDILHWLFGDIKNIQARLANHNHREMTAFEDSGVVTFDFVQGGAGSMSFSTSVWDRNLESSMTVIAEHGSIQIGGQYMEQVKYCHVRDYQLPDLPATSPNLDYGGYKGSAQNHYRVIATMVDLVKGRAAATNAQEALQVVDIIERIYRSGRS